MATSGSRNQMAVTNFVCRNGVHADPFTQTIHQLLTRTVPISTRYSGDMNCPKREELQQQAMNVLRKLNHHTIEQIECVKVNDQKRLLELDKQLEMLFGEKERSFGALLEHSKEHGC